MISEVPFQFHRFITGPTVQTSVGLFLNLSWLQSHIWSEIVLFFGITSWERYDQHLRVKPKQGSA